MDEVFRLADRVTVLRDGRLVRTGAASELTPDALITHMVGRELAQVFPPVVGVPGDVVLEVAGLTREPAYRNISFSLRRGEVLGLAGLMGAGRTEIAEALFGLRPAHAGEIRLHGRTVRLTSPGDALAAGIGMVTEDRKGLGILPAMSVRSNLTLSSLGRFSGLTGLDAASEARTADEQIRAFAIKTSGREQPIGQLSGGNQQKVLLARTLLPGPDLVILDEPTRGIDIGAKAEIYALIGRLAAEGKAVLLISSELPEVLSLTHRLLVLRQGELTAELDPRCATQEEILRHAIPR
jgi:ABC-type sugar transport system ATPase subunit